MNSGEYALKVGVRLIALSLLIVAASVASAQPVTPKRIVVLYWDNKDFPGNILFDEAFKSQLRKSGGDGIEYYPEYLETTRFPGEQYELTYRQYLRDKYAGRHIDVVVASADPTLDFLLK